MAAEHVVAARKANAFLRLEAVRSRISSLLGLSDIAEDDIPGVVKRDRTLFEVARIENMGEFLEAVASQLVAERAQSQQEKQELLLQIQQLQVQLAAAGESAPASAARKGK